MTFDFVADQFDGALRIFQWLGPWLAFVLGWLLFVAVIRALLSLRKVRTGTASGSNGGNVKPPRSESKGG